MTCKCCEEREAVKYSKYTSGEFCSKKCARSYSTKSKRDEINKKVSETLSGRPGHPHTKETRLKISTSMLGNSNGLKITNKKPLLQRKKLKKAVPYITKICPICKTTFKFKRYYSRTYCSKKCYLSDPNKSDNIDYGDCGGYRKNSTRKIREIYKGYQMDSGAELKFAQLLDENDIEWEKNTTISFDYVGVNGEERKYYPDFYLPEHDLWVEVKSQYYKTEQFERKLGAVDNIVVVWDDDIKLPIQLNDTV